MCVCVREGVCVFTTLKAKKKKNKENFLVLSQRFWTLRSQLYHIFILLCSNQIRLLRTLLTKLQNTRKILHDSLSNNMMHHLFLLFAVKQRKSRSHVAYDAYCEYNIYVPERKT